MKTCTRCHTQKEDTAFSWKVLNVRRMAVCKYCISVRQKTPEYKERAKIAYKKHIQSESGKIKQRERCKKFRATQAFKESAIKSRLKYPEKRAAQIKLTNALSSGKVTRPSNCSICGIACKPEGHHYDYSLPLSVIWVCRPCHKAYYHVRG